MSDNKKINDGTEAPKKNELFSLQEKINIINKHDAGISNVKMSCDLGVHEATIRCIQQAEKIKQLGQCASSSISCQSMRNKSTLMIEMERLLLV